jgi:hypothetical protein
MVNPESASQLQALLETLKRKALETSGEGGRQPSNENLIDVIARCEDRRNEDATQQMIAYRDRLMCLFLRLHDQLIKTASPCHLPRRWDHRSATR